MEIRLRTTLSLSLALIEMYLKSVCERETPEYPEKTSLFNLVTTYHLYADALDQI